LFYAPLCDSNKRLILSRPLFRFHRVELGFGGEDRGG
jgi:hypothetical protein